MMLAAQFTIRDAKSMFFDRVKIEKGVDRARLKALSRVGAFVQRRAKSSIRKPRQMRLSDMPKEARAKWKQDAKVAREQGRRPPRRGKAPSRPGEPPRDVTGLLRGWILFGYDPQPQSVVIGPAKLNKSSGAPRTLEEGGEVSVARRRRDGRRFVRRTRIQPRPYMGPAFDAERDKSPEMFRGLFQ
ncbi:MAG: hypothetical protein KF777_01460 [Planctomycetaceae bacterium]|nr:hypothetical protein [Planctomycetaceae bacterium]